MIKEEYIEKAKNDVSILDVFRKLHPEIEIKQKGTRYVSLCPYHDDHNPSLNIDVNKNRIRCYVCGENLNIFQLIQKEKGVSFPESVRYIYENFLTDVPLKNIYNFSDKEADEVWKRKELQKTYMAKAQEFYRKEYLRDHFASNACRNYAEKREDNPEGRWTKEICDYVGFGYASGSGHAFADWAASQGFDLKVMEALGLVFKKTAPDGAEYYCDSFREMLMNPYRDKWGNVIAYTSRNLNYQPGMKGKYKNSPCSDANLIYNKSSTPWGLNHLSEVRQAKKAYLVEGTSDAMTIMGLGIMNVMASIGGEWTNGMLESLNMPEKPLLCFIPDIDEQKENVDGAIMGNGEKFTIRSAFRAIKLGFQVTVKAIPPNEDGTKVDAGEYFTTIKRWNKVKEEDFVVWYAGKYFDSAVSDSENSKAVKTVCRMLLALDDEELSNFYFRMLKKKFRSREVWDDAIRLAKGEINNDIQQKSMEELGLNLKANNMIAKNGCLYTITRNNDPGKRLTNFIPRGLYHIKDDKLSQRIVEVNN